MSTLYDIGCPHCGATYTSAETHRCPAMPVTFSADLCSRCSQPSDDLIDRDHGERVCGRCRAAEKARYDAATAAYRDAGFDDMEPLEQRRLDGDR